MDQGIINAFKIRYRTHVVKRRIEQIEYGSDEVDMTVLDAIKYLGAAWVATTRSTIANCFRKAGFKFDDDDEDNEEDQPITSFRNACSHLNRIDSSFIVIPDDYLNIDAELPFAGALTDEEIVASYMPQVEQESDAEEAETEPEPAMTRAQAMKHLEDFKMFLLQSSEDRRTTLKLVTSIKNEMEIRVMPVQSTITSFFSFEFIFIFFILSFSYLLISLCSK
jgi:hypothetical protein